MLQHRAHEDGVDAVIGTRQRNRRGPGIEVESDHDAIRPDDIGEARRHRARTATQINHTIASAKARNVERGDRRCRCRENCSQPTRTTIAHTILLPSDDVYVGGGDPKLAWLSRASASARSTRSARQVGGDGAVDVAHDTLRNLYADQPLGHGLWSATAWCVGLLVATHTLALRGRTTASSADPPSTLTSMNCGPTCRRSASSRPTPA